MDIQKMKTKDDTIIYIRRTFRDVNRKPQKEIVHKCGLLSVIAKEHEDPWDYINKIKLKLEKEYRDDNEQFIIGKFSTANESTKKLNTVRCGYLIPQMIYSKLGLKKACDELLKNTEIKYDLNSIICSLVTSTILYPGSKLNVFENARKNVEQPDFELHDVYRAISLIGKNIDMFQPIIYKNSDLICKRNTTVLYYDCTNYFRESELQIGLRQFGKGKQNQPNPIVGIGLFMDASGLPLAISAFPGNTNEQITLKPLEKKIIKDFGISDFVFCSDAGLSSYDNRYFNSLGGRYFVITQSIKKMPKYLREWALEHSGFHIENGNKQTDNINIDSVTEEDYENIYYKERLVNDKGDIVDDQGEKRKVSIEQKYIVTFSYKYMMRQRKVRDQQIERAHKIIKNPKMFDKHSASDCKRFIKSLAFTESGEIAQSSILEINNEFIANEAQYDGFYCVATNLNNRASEVSEISHNRWEIEESFRLMKTEFQLRPDYVQTDDAIRGHIFIHFLALLIYRIIEQKMNPLAELTSKRLVRTYTSCDILNTLREMDFRKIKESGFIPNFERTDCFEDFLKVFKLKLGKEGISSEGMRKIIKMTKKS